MSENICKSGGAPGSDVIWTNAARKKGHKVENFTFAGHTPMTSVGLVKLSMDQLDEAEEPLIRANEVLKRRMQPRGFFQRNLLARNWWQVRDAANLYAVSRIGRDGLILGGTGWAVQMFLNERYPLSMHHAAYVFDLFTGKWMKAGSKFGDWFEVDPTRPEGVYAGVGTRDPGEAGMKAILELMTS